MVWGSASVPVCAEFLWRVRRGSWDVSGPNLVRLRVVFPVSFHVETDDIWVENVIGCARGPKIYSDFAAWPRVLAHEINRIWAAPAGRARMVAPMVLLALLGSSMGTRLRRASSSCRFATNRLLPKIAA